MGYALLTVRGRVSAGGLRGRGVRGMSGLRLVLLAGAAAGFALLQERRIAVLRMVPLPRTGASTYLACTAVQSRWHADWGAVLLCAELPTWRRYHRFSAR